MCSVAAGQLYDILRPLACEETEVYTMYRGRCWGVRETVTHLQRLCELKRYLCYICRRNSFQVILSRLFWSGTGGISQVTTNKIVHPNYDPSTISNDVALLRLPIPVTFTSEYPSPVSLMLCVYCGHMWSMFNTVDSTYLRNRHPYNRFCYSQWSSDHNKEWSADGAHYQPCGGGCFS